MMRRAPKTSLKKPSFTAAKPHSSRHSGVALVEFAIVLPVVLVLLLGIIEFGYLMRNQAILASASREGARAAAIGWTQDLVYERVVQSASPLLKTDADGNVTNGGIWIEYDPQPYTANNFRDFPLNYTPLPDDACPTAKLPTRGNLVQLPSSTRKNSAQAQLLATDAQIPTVQFVNNGNGNGNGNKATPAPTPTAAPTPTLAPVPTAMPTPTPVPGATPTSTPEPVPTAGATPTLNPTQTGIKCLNTVPGGCVIRVRVRMTHQPLTRFFPFKYCIRNRLDYVLCQKSP